MHLGTKCVTWISSRRPATRMPTRFTACSARSSESRRYRGDGSEAPQRRPTPFHPEAPSEIAAGATAARLSPTEAKSRTAWLRGWRLRRQQAGYGRPYFNPLFVFSRETRSREAVANAARGTRKPASDEDCETG